MKTASPLTRSVFRALLSNRPYSFSECRAHPRRLEAKNTGSRHHPAYGQKRTFFGLLSESPVHRGFNQAKPTARNLELAIGKLVDLLRARRTQTRPPSHDELLDAFKFLFSSRLELQRHLTRNEIYLASESFKHFQEEGLILAEGTTSLQKEDLGNILTALALPSGKERFRTDSRSLAALVFQALQKQSAEGAGIVSKELLPAYIKVLAKTGSAPDALSLLLVSDHGKRAESIQTWVEVLKGFISEGRDKDFWSGLSTFQKHLGPLHPSSHEQLVSCLARKGKVWESQELYGVPLAEGARPTTKCLKEILEMCAVSRKSRWGSAVAEELLQRSGQDDVIGTLLLWHASQQPDLASLKENFYNLLDANQADINMESFNEAIEYALSRNNPALAAALIDLAENEQLTPNGKTYILQLHFAIDKQDMSSAAQNFEKFITEDMPGDSSDVPVLNKYLAALAFSPSPDYDLMMRVVDNLLERGADMDAEAIAGLCKVFLQRDNLDDATGLLRHRVDSYPANDRARIGAIFRDFILDPKIQEQRAFNAYELFRHAFPETPVALRLPIMQSFFDRKRPDLACLVFGHMRQREDPEDPARPTPVAYARCFEGIAQCRDVDGLQMVYNMLKLDLEVEVTTRIRNGLMLAYIACQLPFSAIIDHFWKIMDSREGPTYSTFEVALRACETWVPQGSFEARKIIAVMQSWNLEITKELYDCYIGALAGQSEFENTVELIEEMQRSIGEAPDAFTLGTFYNAIPWQYRKDEVERWGKQAYPELWDELVSYGEEIDEEWEIRYFRIDRSINIDDEPLFATGEYKPEISQKEQEMLEPGQE